MRIFFLSIAIWGVVDRTATKKGAFSALDVGIKTNVSGGGGERMLKGRDVLLHSVHGAVCCNCGCVIYVTDWKCTESY